MNPPPTTCPFCEAPLSDLFKDERQMYECGTSVLWPQTRSNACKYSETLLARAKAAEELLEKRTFAYAKDQQEISQLCGKALGYPWFKDHQKNFPGHTEEDGVCTGEHVAVTIAEELAKAHVKALAKIKRLEETADFMKAIMPINCAEQMLAVENYTQAKATQ